MNQLKLDGVPAPESHANRGMQFETSLRRTHDYYERQGIAKIEKLPNAWVYCSEAEYRKLPDELKARTAKGRPLKREKTSCDYLGTAKGRGVAFDAKEFARASIPFSQFTAHQVRRLAEYARVGTLAGFLILSKRADAVFWIGAEEMNVLFHSSAMKSLSLAWLQQPARLICERASQVTIDWVKVLLPDTRLFLPDPIFPI